MMDEFYPFFPGARLEIIAPEILEDAI